MLSSVPASLGTIAAITPVSAKCSRVSCRPSTHLYCKVAGSGLNA